MKKTSIIFSLVFIFASCGPLENRKKNKKEIVNYKYSYCGQVQSSNNALQLVSSNGTYNLTFENNQNNLINQLNQMANSNQKTCVKTNIEPQSSSGGEGFVGYSLPNIIVQSIEGQNTSGQNNYATEICGSIFKGNNFQGQSVYFVQSNGSSSSSSVTTYRIEPQSNLVTTTLSQVTQSSNGCVYSNSQPQSTYEGPIISAQQITLQ